jgi:hypothetical protein
MPSTFGREDLGWFHSKGATHRQDDGQQTYSHHQHRERANEGDFLRARSALDQADEREASQNSTCGNPEGHLREPTPENHRDSTATTGAEGKANTNLTGSPGNGESVTE